MPNKKNLYKLKQNEKKESLMFLKQIRKNTIIINFKNNSKI